MQDAPSDDATTFRKHEYAGAYHRVLMSSDPLYIAKITKALSLIRDGGSVDGDIVSPRVAIATDASERTSGILGTLITTGPTVGGARQIAVDGCCEAEMLMLRTASL